MTNEQLIAEIQKVVDALAKREPNFTGSLTLQVHFHKGQPKNIVKEIEKSTVSIS